jgi:sulfur relay (sulfurtransferase) DsrF/TusC family protein
MYIWRKIMEELIILSIFTIAVLVYDLIKTKKENKILYNNYQTALKILSEYDPKLKEYLERENKI